MTADNIAIIWEDGNSSISNGLSNKRSVFTLAFIKFAIAEKRRVKMVLEDLIAKDLQERNITAVYLLT